MIGSRDIGLIKLISFLGNWSNVGNFHSLGSFPRLRDRLNKEAIDGAASSANVLSIQSTSFRD